MRPGGAKETHGPEMRHPETLLGQGSRKLKMKKVARSLVWLRNATKKYLPCELDAK